jgi:peptidoglycan/xylan/chitin deacetylase (PgdA/CDA1 family)
LKIASNLGYTVIGGDVLGGDGFEKNTDVIVKKVISKVRPGSIVVLHMMGGPNAPHTGDALPIIIRKLKKKGYTFVTISDVLKLSVRKQQ